MCFPILGTLRSHNLCVFARPYPHTSAYIAFIPVFLNFKYILYPNKCNESTQKKLHFFYHLQYSDVLNNLHACKAPSIQSIQMKKYISSTKNFFTKKHSNLQPHFTNIISHGRKISLQTTITHLLKSLCSILLKKIWILYMHPVLS